MNFNHPLLSRIATFANQPSLQSFSYSEKVVFVGTMQSLSVFVVLALLQSCVYTQSVFSMDDSPNPVSPRSEVPNIMATSPSQEAEFKLSNDQWQRRVVLAFAPSKRSPAYQQQLKAWQTDAEGINDRNLKLVEVLGTGESQTDGQPISSVSAEHLRQQFGVNAEDFVVILVGKDGTEKQRSQTPVDLTALFRTIDTMPMRQQEMRARQ